MALALLWLCLYWYIRWDNESFAWHYNKLKLLCPIKKGSRLLDRLYDGFFRVFNRFM